MFVAADVGKLGAVMGKEAIVVADEKAGGAANAPFPYPAGVRHICRTYGRHTESRQLCCHVYIIYGLGFMRE